MKIKSSMKILDGYKKVFRCGYCDLQIIYKFVEPTYYNTGVYGWNCDIYTYGSSIAITTGYRNMRGERIPYDILIKYDKIAREILEKRLTYNELEKELAKNRMNFLNELIEL